MNLRDQLTRDEGRKLRLYIDSVGKSSIGVGRDLTDVGISIDESDYLLGNDIRRVVLELPKVLPVTQTLDPARLMAVQNMFFNLDHRLLGFHDFISALERRDWVSAAREMKNSKWAAQVGIRADRLEKQIISGEVQ